MIPQSYPLFATLDTNDVQLFAVVGWIDSDAESSAGAERACLLRS